MPANVLCSGLGGYVKSFDTALLSDEQVSNIASTLRELKATSGLTKSDHLASLKQRHASTVVCPKCGGRMVARTAKNSGKQFVGCSNFPKCHHTIWPKRAT